MKAQLEKHKGKIVLLEVGEDSNRENLKEEENMIMELQDKVKHLKLEQKPEIEELRKSVASIASVGTFGQDQATNLEEHTMDYNIE
jgi:hypothetical protein